jgi:hypothetical protein
MSKKRRLEWSFFLNHRTAVAAPAAAHSQQNKQTGSPKRPQKSSKIGGHRQNNLVE